MTLKFFGRRASVLAFVFTIWALPITSVAQSTRVTLPKNKYKVGDDVRLGEQEAAKIERQFPIMNDAEATAYISKVGERLVAAIPPQFDQPEFHYRFKLINARDINAFALPGGPMYVNRGMIQSARNEGEVAGVMAHEISHVALRHATAQATKQSSAKSTLGQLGMILGGAIVGGQAGAQLGQMGAAAWMTKYSRDYESQADMLGAQIMAAAGYDPRDLANVFQTIAGQSKGGGPSWLSTHPDPGNRFEKINREASLLNVSRNPIKVTPGFQRIKAKFGGMSAAPSMADIQNGRAPVTRSETGSGGRYMSTVERPAAEMRPYSKIRWLRVNVPENWRELPGESGVQFAPEGGYGDQGITHGLMLGILPAPQNGGDLASGSETYLNEVLQNNAYLQKRSAFRRTNVGGRQGLFTVLGGRSPVTGRNENVRIYTVQLRNGQIFYAATVVPEAESVSYDDPFRSVLGSLTLSE